MLKFDKLLLIGSDLRKAGKTTLACALIKKNSKHDLIAVKITLLSEDYLKSNHKNITETHRCLSQKGYCVIEERNPGDQNDTTRFLAAGANRSFWLQVLEEHLWEAFETILKETGKDAVIVCESTSLRKVVEPGIFIMISSGLVSSARKKSADDVKKYADVIGPFDTIKSENLVQKINFDSSRWKLVNWIPFEPDLSA